MALQVWRPGWGLRHWHPFREFEDVERWPERFFDWPVLRRGPVCDLEYIPSMELVDRGDRYVVKAELPGLKEKDVDVSVCDNVLTVKGEKKASKETKEEDYHFSEMTYGSFCRSVTLPSGVETEYISANFEDGVLEVSVPKTPEVKPKKIKVGIKKTIEGK
jgi:HSP20 family protein